MSAISLRLPESLHEALREMARRENISINQFVTLALAEKLSALMTEEYLEKRAKRAARDNFDAALRKVVDVEPEDQDRL
jgi:predicted DNA-binding ribbon-helix-helix protein